MIEIQSIKSTIDLLALVNCDTTTKRVASTGGGEYAGPCPSCEGHDRFRIQPHHPGGGRWFCRGCGDGKWHDVIDYVKWRDDVSFTEAISILNLQPKTDTKYVKHKPVKKNRNVTDTPTELWQTQARKFHNECEVHLQNDAGKKALEYLQNERHLTLATIKKYRIGYNPSEKYMKPEDWGLSGRNVWIPRGIVIPCFIERKLWNINIRRYSGNPKYIKIRGSKGALFGANNICGSGLILLTEGEFDAMLADQEIGNIIGVATFGSVRSALDIKVWGKYLIPARAILVANDSDTVGLKASERLAEQSHQIYSMRVPVLKIGSKDITDYYRDGGDLMKWLNHHLLRLGLVTQLSGNNSNDFVEVK